MVVGTRFRTDAFGGRVRATKLICRVFSQLESDDATELSEARLAVVERLATIATDRAAMLR